MQEKKKTFCKKLFFFYICIFFNWKLIVLKYCFGVCRACTLCHFSHVRLFVTPWTVACQAPLSMDSPRQVYWNGLLCPLPGNLPSSGIKPAASPASCALQSESLLRSHPGSLVSALQHRKSAVTGLPLRLEPPTAAQPPV